MTEETKEQVHPEEETENKENDQQEENQGEQKQEQAKSKTKKPKRRNNTSKLKKEIEELKEKNEDLRDKYLRLYADFDNYKKRAAKERLELLNEAGKDVILELLPVLDDFERSLKTMEESDNVEAVKEGSELIFHKLKKNLELKGLKQMESIGKDFDPEYHEAITEIPAPSDEEKGKVLDEIEKGYYLNDKILRYAKVVVGK